MEEVYHWVPFPISFLCLVLVDQKSGLNNTKRDYEGLLRFLLVYDFVRTIVSPSGLASASTYVCVCIHLMYYV